MPRALVLLLGLAFVATACVAVGPAGGSGQTQSRTTAPDGGTAPSVDDAPTCDVACTPLECGEGMHPAPVSGECCPTICEPDDCDLVDCPPLVCPSGKHATKPSTSCCKVCTPDPAPLSGETCTDGQAGYDSYREQLATSLGASSCTLDGDCRIVVIDNPCGHDCGTAVAARVAATFAADLNDYAAAHCTACPTPDDVCPATEHAAFCTGGVCSAH